MTHAATRIYPPRGIVRALGAPLSAAARQRLVALRSERQHRWARAATQARASAKARRRCKGSGRAHDAVWSDQLCRLLLQGLAATGNVRAVSRILGVDSATFYAHRKARLGLAHLWRQALNRHAKELIDLLIDRAKHGWEEEVWHLGKCVGVRRRTCNKLMLDVVRLLLQRDKERKAARMERERAKALAEAAASARVEMAGIPRRGRLAPPLTLDGADEDEGPLSPRHALFLDLMNRHRERRPDEWDGDAHLESGFNFNDWRTWLEAKVAQRLAAEGEG